MKNIFIGLFCLSALLCGHSVFGESDADDKKIRERIHDQRVLVSNAGDEKDYEKSKEGMATLFDMISEPIPKDREFVWAATISSACHKLDNLRFQTKGKTSRQFSELAKEYGLRFMRINFKTPDAIDRQLSVLMRLLSRNLLALSTEKKEYEEFAKERKQLTEKAVDLWNRLVVISDPTFRIDDYQDELKPLSDLTPYYLIVDRIPDLKERQRLLDYKKRRLELLRQANYQQMSNRVIKQNSDEFKKTLISFYTTPPYDYDEIEKILDGFKGSEQLKKEILEPIRKKYEWHQAGFREWESSDGLFKATAKMISADKKEVKLEKEDGKRTSIELSALRKEDQDYVKRQLESETKKLLEEKPKK